MPKHVCLTLLLLCLSVFFLGTNSTSDDRIVGGRPAEYGEFPYQVSLRRSFNDNHFCGGSVIGPRHVLTAAHCMYYVWGGLLPAMVVSVAAGQTGLELGPQSIIRNATVIHVHPEFNNQEKANDIAIVEVDSPFPLESEIVSMAALRTDAVKTGTNCTVTGWGTHEFGNNTISPELMAAGVSVIEFKCCKELYGKADIALSPGMMCAGLPDGSKDACQGDSGGPLFCSGQLTGVISTAIGCANPAFPGIYTEISQYVPWINSILYTKSPWL